MLGALLTPGGTFTASHWRALLLERLKLGPSRFYWQWACLHVPAIGGLKEPFEHSQLES